MSKRHDKNQAVEEIAENEVIVETVEEGKETEEMEVTKKKGFFKTIIDGGKKVVKSTPFKVAVGAAIGVGATVGAMILSGKNSSDCYDESDFEDDSMDVELPSAAEAEPNTAEEN